MALSSDITWEVRPSAGSDTNGGGFVFGATGTDFSQQDSPQITFTDLVAATTTTFTSALNPFTSAHVGNIINITGGTGFTTGRYKINSVSSAVATFDRAAATAASTGGAGKLGGALATLGPAGSLSLTSVFYYIKATGTLTITAVIDNGAADVFMVGYTTTRGDNGRATLTTSSNIDPFILARNTGRYLFQNLIITNTAATRQSFWVPIAEMNYVGFINCQIVGFTRAINGNSKTIDYLEVSGRTEIKSCTQSGLDLYNVKQGVLSDCYIHDNTNQGVQLVGDGFSSLVFIRCVIKSNGGHGVFNSIDNTINVAGSLQFVNCAILNNTSDGIRSFGGGSNFALVLILQNNIIDSNGGYGVNIKNYATQYIMNSGFNNAFRSNTSGARNNFPTLTGDIVLTGDPFTARGSDDFSLNNTAGAGADCKAVAFPVAFP